MSYSSLTNLAERTRFELVDRIAPIVGLANRWFQPLTHLSNPRYLPFYKSNISLLRCKGRNI